ncbi:two-component system, OmpR family, alkaline phosphatase synthesis response regulator PhoP [Arachidicoccus rhizosphaerae]|uniref:Two-component system, OmpR family, alkaline phosphatase synthesis response regulator PhoP n=1 Tax=Arachidicoccus rhizosphaerae TaxID=551991 RepID=A0A1H4AXT6_9BACT|nr:response regulator transcription factor [Arachidicoccus rhizosphaerae]SEA40442.1 two-component system, OmpR family, alkaline phosphatase synthesis response regulator PhoP [Arachidicoccus rhizosphaerae]
MDAPARKILIVDDEPDILEIIGYHLRKEGFDVYEAPDGNRAIELARQVKPDLIVLDRMMPGKNGLEVLEILRAQPAFEDTLIIFLTAVGGDAHEIEGLEGGADDYVNKPIKPKLLISRINALLRRSPKVEDDKVLEINDIKIDPVQFIVYIEGQPKLLAKKEFALLYLLASKPGRVFLRTEILHKVWGTDVIVGDRTIDVHIRKIRSKLDLDCITTVKGVGYKFELPS